MPPALHDVTIDLPLDDSTPGLRGILGVPDGPGPHPAVIVVHEAFGTTREMRDQVEHLARLGYLALMPDLFTAGGFVRCIGATARAMTRGTGRAWADIEASRRWLATREDFSGATGIIGFCMGGGFALLAGTRGYEGGASPYEAAAVNYGILPADLDEIEHSCPVVASYGSADKTVRDAPPRLEALYTRLGVPHDVKEYPGAGHAFMNERFTGPAIIHPFQRVMGIAPDPAAAADAWVRIAAFFDAHGLERA